MTLGKILKLIEALKEGKEIIMVTTHHGYASSYTTTDSIKSFEDIELNDLLDKSEFSDSDYYTTVDFQLKDGGEL